MSSVIKREVGYKGKSFPKPMKNIKNGVVVYFNKSGNGIYLTGNNLGQYSDDIPMSFYEDVESVTIKFS